MAATRSAHHTLSGYHYQFDKSILTILRASQDDLAVTLEGIEDIDIEDESIQCKYHASQKYTRSAIKKPLIAFLKHYSTSNARLRYTLYAHFKNHDSFNPIDLTELKAILGGDLDRLGLDDSDLTAFLTRHFRYEEAKDIDSQLEEVHQAIIDALNCERSESEMYFYNNALHEVIRLSRQSDVSSRTTTRVAFLRVINHKCALFSIWLAQLKGAKSYVDFIRRELRAQKAMATTKNRFIQIDARLLRQCGIGGLVRFCTALIESNFKPGKALKDATPISLIVNLSEEDTVALKKALLAGQIAFNDGYEHLDFQPWHFNLAPILNVKQSRTGKTTDTIDKCSYCIRIISQQTYVAHAQSIDRPDTLLFTGSAKESPLLTALHTQVFHLSELATLDDLSAVLT